MRSPLLIQRTEQEKSYLSINSTLTPNALAKLSNVTRHQHALLQLGKGHKEFIIMTFVEILDEVTEEREIGYYLVYFGG